jgi:hypothetical protein
MAEERFEQPRDEELEELRRRKGIL